MDYLLILSGYDGPTPNPGGIMRKQRHMNVQTLSAFWLFRQYGQPQGDYPSKVEVDIAALRVIDHGFKLTDEVARILNWILFSCDKCGGECAVAPDLPQKAYCMECCPDHDYKHDPHRRGWYCEICDRERIDRD